MDLDDFDVAPLVHPEADDTHGQTPGSDDLHCRMDVDEVLVFRDGVGGAVVVAGDSDDGGFVGIDRDEHALLDRLDL